jgi:hypothetical protein
LSGGFSSTTRQCEGVIRSSLTCAAFVAEDMTLLLLGVGDDSVNAILPEAATVRTRVTPGGRALVSPFTVCVETGNEECGQGGRGSELARDRGDLGGVVIPTAGLVEVHHGGQRMTL